MGDWSGFVGLVVVVGIFAIDVPQAATRNEHVFARLPIPVGALVAAVLIAVTLFAVSTSQVTMSRGRVFTRLLVMLGRQNWK